MKRIVICCDGTWNSPDEEKDGVPITTNVVKLAQAVLPLDPTGIEQVMYYDPGVGTSGNWFKKLFDGATGTGLSRNILEAYYYLILNYHKDDELFFFGFSRGAYTVRSLAGLIRNCGILRPEFAEMTNRAYELYRSGRKSTHPKEKEAILFRRTYAVSDITRIKFIGVWDTVGSLGNPLLLNGILSRRNRFHDTELSSTIDNAYQALAIDEKRRHFKAAMWHKQAHSDGQILEQVWFVGVHSNVGGGYKSTGLSDIALDWLAQKAANCGLLLNSISLNKDPLEAPKESRKSFYLTIPSFYRPINNYADQNKGITNESLHESVLVRYSNDQKYRPKNLEVYFIQFPEKRPKTK
ncbi:DUF2235 domain-containing protein [bacterium]|nr:MAG: DUF2235 domain-containing protein [bacterium]